MNPTQGMKSSEFITSLAPIVVGIVLVLLGALKGQQQLLDTGLYCLLGGSGIYGVSRGLTKLGAGIGGAQTPPAPQSAPASDEDAAKIVAGVK